MKCLMMFICAFGMKVNNFLNGDFLIAVCLQITFSFLNENGSNFVVSFEY